MDWFLSDLHMFSRRSIYAEHERQILECVGEARNIVLGGDIFDFSWTTLPSIDHTIDAAMQWLAHLVESNSSCQFYYLLGNHDCHDHFVRRLAENCEHHENLHWEPFFLRMGTSVMLHGDAVHTRQRTNQSLAIARNQRHQYKQPRYRHGIYDLAIRSRIHRVVGTLANPKKIIARRIWEYLQNERVDMATEIEDVYFGHTHVPMHDFSFRGVNFHNGGASISGLQFHMVPMRIDVNSPATFTTKPRLKS